MTISPIANPALTPAAPTNAVAISPSEFGRDAIVTLWTTEKIHEVAYGG